jgi:signal-transduction protein with cAMP-binding, CBS, and nucleotidyltransferase domain
MEPHKGDEIRFRPLPGVSPKHARLQELFTQWTHLPKPDALLDAAIFFDFRKVAGRFQWNRSSKS